MNTVEKIEKMLNATTQVDEKEWTTKVRLIKRFAHKADGSAVVIALPQPGAVDLIRERRLLHTKTL